MYFFFTLTLILSSAQPFPFPRQNTSKEGSDPHPGVPGDPRLRLSHSMRLKRERQRIICPLARPASESNTPSTNAFGQSTNYPPSTYNDVPMTPMQRHEQLLHEERKLFACWIARRNAKAPPRRRNNRASYTDLPPPFENGNTSYRALFRRQYSHLFTEPGEEPPRHSKFSILFAVFSFSLILTLNQTGTLRFLNISQRGFVTVRRRRKNSVMLLSRRALQLPLQLCPITGNHLQERYDGVSTFLVLVFFLQLILTP